MTGPLQVRQVVTDDSYSTRLTPLARDTLPRLARLLADTGVIEDFWNLAYNDNPVHGASIADRIARHIGDALWEDAAGIDLTPEDAERLTEEIADTVLEPVDCRCGRFAAPALGAGDRCTVCYRPDPYMTAAS